MLILMSATATGTWAYLSAKTDPVTHTFTAGTVSVRIIQGATATVGTGGGTGSNFIMTPNQPIAVNDVVVVNTENANCWLFVKVEKSATFDNFMTYTMATGWQELTGVPGVYCRTVQAAKEATMFSILAGNQIMVLNTVTADMMNGLTSENRPQITFTAYVIQNDGFEDNPAGAWNALNIPRTENPENTNVESGI